MGNGCLTDRLFSIVNTLVICISNMKWYINMFWVLSTRRQLLNSDFIYTLIWQISGTTVCTIRSVRTRHGVRDRQQSSRAVIWLIHLFTCEQIAVLRKQQLYATDLEKVLRFFKLCYQRVWRCVSTVCLYIYCIILLAWNVMIINCYIWH